VTGSNVNVDERVEDLYGLALSKARVHPGVVLVLNSESSGPY